MATMPLKQLMVALLRLSLDRSAERFAVLGDPQIARAFAAMVTAPGLTHRVGDLAQIGSQPLGFNGFSQVVGKTLMVALRDLRMQQALVLLTTTKISLDQAAAEVGYSSHGSFVRAFERRTVAAPRNFDRPRQRRRFRTTFNAVEVRHGRGHIRTALTRPQTAKFD
jgi:AraC family transcriptional activator of mtrCDE